MSPVVPRAQQADDSARGGPAVPGLSCFLVSALTLCTILQKQTDVAFGHPERQNIWPLVDAPVGVIDSSADAEELARQRQGMLTFVGSLMDSASADFHRSNVGRSVSSLSYACPAKAVFSEFVEHLTADIANLEGAASGGAGRASSSPSSADLL